MKDFLLNIARLNALRLLCHKIISKQSDEACYREFVCRMNSMAKEYGLTNTEWINPSGLGESGLYSVSTARDLAIMASKACQNDIIIDVWKEKEYSIKIQKGYILRPKRKREKTKIVYSTIPFKYLDDKFKVLGAKTGSGDGYQTLVMVCEIDSQIVAGAIMNAHDENDRFVAMSELMMIVKEKLSKVSEMSLVDVKSADNACAYLIEKGGQISCVYEKNADIKSAPMSTTKVMTLLTASKYIENTTEKVYIMPCDFRNAPIQDFLPWEKVSINDIMYAAMLPSSNVASNVLARITGERILEKS